MAGKITLDTNISIIWLQHWHSADFLRLADLFDVRAGLLRQVEAPVGEVEECEDGRHDYPGHVGRVTNPGPPGSPAAYAWIWIRLIIKTLIHIFFFVGKDPDPVWTPELRRSRVFWNKPGVKKLGFRTGHWYFGWIRIWLLKGSDSDSKEIGYRYLEKTDPK